MAELRTLRCDCPTHPKVGRLSDRAARMWQACILSADDWGRFRLLPERFRLYVWGYHPDVSEADVIAAMNEIICAGLAVAWCPRPQIVIVEMHHFPDHQPLRNRKPSRYGEPSAIVPLLGPQHFSCPPHTPQKKEKRNDGKRNDGTGNETTGREHVPHTSSKNQVFIGANVVPSGEDVKSLIRGTVKMLEEKSRAMEPK